jgi:hypothetical protein
MGPDFEDHVTTVLVGIAVRRGEDWSPIVERGMRAPRQTDGGAERSPDSLTA